MEEEARVLVMRLPDETRVRVHLGEPEYFLQCHLNEGVMGAGGAEEEDEQQLQDDDDDSHEDAGVAKDEHTPLPHSRETQRVVW